MARSAWCIQTFREGAGKSFACDMAQALSRSAASISGFCFTKVP